jgi:hypothetical protein
MPEYHLRFAVPGPSAGYTPQAEQRSRPYEIARCGTKPKMRSKRLA